jgi:hypothetical protein
MRVTNICGGVHTREEGFNSLGDRGQNRAVGNAHISAKFENFFHVLELLERGPRVVMSAPRCAAEVKVALR